MTDLDNVNITKLDLNLSDMIKAVFQHPIKDTSEEYKFLKKVLGEYGALAYYRGDESVIEKVKANLNEEICKMSSIQRKCCNRELLTAHYLKQINSNGVPVNVVALKKLCEEAQQVYQEAYRELFSKCEDIGVVLSTEYIHGQGEISTVDDDLMKEIACLRKLWKHTLLLDFEKLATSIRQDIDGNNRIFCTFESFAAISGRIQSHKPNIQGFPKNVREECFQVPEGKALIFADYVSEELSIMAVLAHDNQLLVDIKNNVDFHLRVASKLFNKNTHEVTALERTVAKRLTFACLYGAGENRLKTTAFELLGKDDKTIAKDIKKTIEAEYSAIKVLAEKIKNENKLTFIDGQSISLETVEKKFTAVNRCIQGSGSIVLKQVIVDLMDSLSPESRIVCLIHDELIIECPIEKLKECQVIVSETMKFVLKNFDIDVELPIEMVIRKDETYELY